MRNAAIVIRGSDIVAIGDAAIAGRYRAARTVDAGGRFVIPASGTCTCISAAARP
jgi:predicted amidohydrolase YtcJ